jgi:malonate decarboxylase beta subunit
LLKRGLPAQQRSRQAELYLQRLARLDAAPQIEPSVVRDLYQGERS